MMKLNDVLLLFFYYETHVNLNNNVNKSGNNTQKNTNVFTI